MSDAQFSSAGLMVTQPNLNPILQIVTWLLLAVTTLMLGFRLLASFYLKAKRKPGWEDVLILIAYAFSLGESVIMLLPGSRIFGKEIADISADEVRIGLQLDYSRDLLFILSLGFAKCSVNAGLRAISPGQHGLPTVILGTAITLWTLSSLLVVAFQCGDRMPWDRHGSRCIEKRRFLEYLCLSNILTDFALIVIPIHIIWPLKMAKKNRLKIIFIFGLRSLLVTIHSEYFPWQTPCLPVLRVIVATICQIVYLPQLFEVDYTLDALPYYITIQVVQFVSITAACVVYFLPFLRSLQSGLVWGDNTTFTSNHSPSKFSKSWRDGTTQRNDGGSVGRDHNNYIKITTENSVVSKERSNKAEPLAASRADMYPLTGNYRHMAYRG